ncbi:hypothetical protein [Leisingera sp. JC1]|uniref:hypothetical protein n=1 Tax=Leisingera sp. JC1 TaxID=1855282 RepID=UPI000807A5FC|nr:hypothetical protein [Leisingera sp. JC1]OBY25225.1 hypothetical protein A9D60_22445 [Leisingera sp. JC1]
MPKSTIEEVWNRIGALAGREFQTISGKTFTYSMDGDGFITSRTDYRLGRADVEKALALVPLSGPGEVNQLVRGPAYLWAILHDQRVRNADW